MMDKNSWIFILNHNGLTLQKKRSFFLKKQKVSRLNLPPIVYGVQIQEISWSVKLCLFNVKLQPQGIKNIGVLFKSAQNVH